MIQDIDHARRIVAYSNLGSSNIVVIEAHRFIVQHDTKIEQRMERWMGWDD
jgi:hypothetical protein